MQTLSLLFPVYHSLQTARFPSGILLRTIGRVHAHIYPILTALWHRNTILWHRNRNTIDQAFVWQARSAHHTFCGRGSASGHPFQGSATVVRREFWRRRERFAGSHNAIRPFSLPQTRSPLDSLRRYPPPCFPALRHLPEFSMPRLLPYAA